MIRIAQFSDLHYGTKNLTEADRCFGAAIDRAIALGVQVAVVSGDATDHALDLHAPAAERLFAQVRRLADHCPVLMLQGTFSHEPPGTLAIFRLLGGRHPVHVAERIEQVALTAGQQWVSSTNWCFDALPADTLALFTCMPAVNKAAVAATVGATDAAQAVGDHLSLLLRGYAPIHRVARVQGLPTICVSHGTVFGCLSEHGVPMAGFDHEFTTGKGEQKEGFDILVHDGESGESKSVGLVSGGERVWINECLIRAVALYLVQHTGRRYSVLFSDGAAARGAQHDEGESNRFAGGRPAGGALRCQEGGAGKGHDRPA